MNLIGFFLRATEKTSRVGNDIHVTPPLSHATNTIFKEMHDGHRIIPEPMYGQELAAKLSPAPIG
jgi:hypothetical protein